MKVASSQGDAASSPFFKRAIEIDPQFAMAHARLGLAYMSVAEIALSMERLGAARH